MKRLSIAVTIAVAVAAALVVSSVALATGTLNGAYTTRISSKPLGGALKGTWTLDFHNGSYTVANNGTTVIRGKYSTRDSKMTMQNGHGRDACQVTTPGVYRYKLAGHKLTFHKLSGSKQCVGRDTVLSYTFTKLG